MTQPTPHDPASQPPPGPPIPGDGAPATAARRSWFARHKILTAIGAVVLLVIVMNAVNGGDDAATPATGGSSASQATESDAASQDGAESTENEPAEDSEPAAATIGTPVRDGKFEFTVTSLEPGVEHIGSDGFGVDAQGQFLLVHVTVTNIGDEAQYFDGSSQDLTDTEGRTHSADSSAAIYLDDSNSFLNQINPGNSVDGVVVFDIPVGAVPASIELHDSAWSGGVTVSLE